MIQVSDMSTSRKVDAVFFSFALSFALVLICVPVTMSFADDTWTTSQRALLLVVGVGVLTLITMVVAFFLSLVLRISNTREIARIDKETALVYQRIEQLKWQHLFETYHQNPQYQSSLSRKRRLTNR